MSHFVHGDQVDENDLKDEKEDLQKALLNPLVFDQISSLICNLIPEVNRLKELFMCWSSLKPEERAIIDAGASHLPGLVLYNPLIEAMRRWEFVQDTQGAPGCEPGLVTLNDPALEQALVKTVIAVEQILTHFEPSNSKEILRCTSAAELMMRYLSEGEPSERHYNRTKTLTRSVSLDDIISL